MSASAPGSARHPFDVGDLELVDPALRRLGGLGGDEGIHDRGGREPVRDHAS